ncbi:glutaredoxin family protein [Candidatus Woesebacteria bacterium]|nr:glutaredoxin family protein [Candidatus Woesebacteria bacterium]
MKVTIYSTTACPYCKMLKNYLDENNITYEEKMVDRDENARNEMTKDSGGFMGVPFMVVKDENGDKENVIGFDKEKINKVLGLL